MLVINSIEKTRLSADSYSYSGTGVAWKARLVLFLGFALMAGGLAGSVVSRYPKLKNKREREVLSSMCADLTVAADGHGAEVCRAKISVSDALFRHCECYR